MLISYEFQIFCLINIHDLAIRRCQVYTEAKNTIGEKYVTSISRLSAPRTLTQDSCLFLLTVLISLQSFSFVSIVPIICFLIAISRELLQVVYILTIMCYSEEIKFGEFIRCIYKSFNLFLFTFIYLLCNTVTITQFEKFFSLFFIIFSRFSNNCQGNCMK